MARYGFGPRRPMTGYLNAPSPFDAEGWFDTQDLVETKGEFIRFLGRRSEVVNVGGQKVYPAEVENVLLQMPNVGDATVAGETTPSWGRLSWPASICGTPKSRPYSGRGCEDFVDLVSNLLRSPHASSLSTRTSSAVASRGFDDHSQTLEPGDIHLRSRRDGSGVSGASSY